MPSNTYLIRILYNWTWRNGSNADKVNGGAYGWEMGVWDRDTNRDIYTKHLGTVWH